jgi:uncharacterized protein YukE
MADRYLEELERLIRRLIEAWDGWLDADENFGPAYEILNAAVEALRRQLQEHES